MVYWPRRTMLSPMQTARVTMIPTLVVGTPVGSLARFAVFAEFGAGEEGVERVGRVHRDLVEEKGLRRCDGESGRFQRGVMIRSFVPGLTRGCRGDRTGLPLVGRHSFGLSRSGRLLGRGYWWWSCLDKNRVRLKWRNGRYCAFFFSGCIEWRNFRWRAIGPVYGQQHRLFDNPVLLPAIGVEIDDADLWHPSFRRRRPTLQCLGRSFSISR